MSDKNGIFIILKQVFLITKSVWYFKTGISDYKICMVILCNYCNMLCMKLIREKIWILFVGDDKIFDKIVVVEDTMWFNFHSDFSEIFETKQAGSSVFMSVWGPAQGHETWAAIWGSAW